MPWDGTNDWGTLARARAQATAEVRSYTIERSHSDNLDCDSYEAKMSATSGADLTVVVYAVLELD
eukprot:CAMPEP_0184741370 /NCGR_PEP_ID=MMETSP0315-20130426/4386_1 /TAXON_ID=101924 /ORGANISM="Rhodosorus marinus, Strain UTEX LB 2760" /LENGTH=64 /DNA_ID=CAMNT_0027211597 /DNA_START=622 /DNA_END=816 /DNA_ORIENTATION=+